jgi:hypothetical protein
MARIFRASLVLMLLLVTACRFGAARQEVLFRFAVSAILNAAAATESPVAAASPRPMPVQQATIVPAAVSATAPAAEPACPSMRVNAIDLPIAELRPAVEVARPLLRAETLRLERRIAIARIQFDRLETKRKVREIDDTRCKEAARIRAEALARELRVAHLILSADEGNTCLVDPDASPAPMSTDEIQSLETIGG